VMDPKHIKPDAMIELRDAETKSWLPLTIVSVEQDNVECRTLAGEPVLMTRASLIADARLRPRDGSCADCGWEAHDGPCIECRCSECGAEVGSRCSQHPQQPVHVYRRQRYLAEIVEDKPYPTREQSHALRRDLVEQMGALRSHGEVRQGRVVITTLERAEILSALENAVRLIDSLPTEKRRPS